MSMMPPKQRPMPPPPTRSPSSPAQAGPKKSFSISQGALREAFIALMYGPGGSGKTSAVANAVAAGFKPVIVDLEGGSHFLDVARISGVSSFTELRDVLHDTELLAPFDLVCIDSLTVAEELTVKHVIESVPRNDQNQKATSLESYGFGKGLTYVYEHFLLLLSDLDALRRAGKSIVCICHDCTASVPNPNGEDWIRYEPRLQSPTSGKSSIRLRVREWCDHMLYVGYDVAVDGGKGRGSGTRSIYPVEMPTHMAKSRVLSQPIAYEKGSCEIWNLLKGS